jgi:hypothetical protein
MEQALSVLSPMPETSDQVQHFISLAVNEALSGDTDLLDLYRRLYAAKEALSGIIDGIKPYLLQEAAKYAARGEFDAYGVRYSIAQRTTYEYKASEWSTYQDALRTVKECEAFLKALKSPVADPTTGEMIDPVPVKVSESLTVKRY